MPPKKVLQYKCDRCPSLWYAEENKPEPPCSIEIKADFGDGGAVLHTKFECLCASCRQTVHALTKQIARTLQKTSAIRVAKKKKVKDGATDESADKDSTSSASPTTQSVPAPQTLAPPEASSSASRTQSVPAHTAVAAGVGKAPPVIAAHPRR
jgi:hypothetical protein